MGRDKGSNRGTCIRSWRKEICKGRNDGKDKFIKWSRIERINTIDSEYSDGIQTMFNAMYTVNCNALSMFYPILLSLPVRDAAICVLLTTVTASRLVTKFLHLHFRIRLQSVISSWHAWIRSNKLCRCVQH